MYRMSLLRFRTLEAGSCKLPFSELQNPTCKRRDSRIGRKQIATAVDKGCSCCRTQVGLVNLSRNNEEANSANWLLPLACTCL
jgi:hypothetical protein